VGSEKAESLKTCPDMKELRKKTALIVSFVAAAIACIPIGYVWLTLLGRTYLFFVYGCRPYVNHVDDGYFDMIPRYAHNGLCIAALATVLSLIARRRRLTIFSVLLVGSALLAPLFLDFLHRTKMLVIYEEFLAPAK
jgi:hypothetical protein